MLQCEAAPEGSAERARLRARHVHMVNLGIECSLSQLLDPGIMHADPHPGNLVLTPDNRLVYLDFGLLTYVPAQSCQVLLSLGYSVRSFWSASVGTAACLSLVCVTACRVPRHTLLFAACTVIEGSWMREHVAVENQGPRGCAAGDDGMPGACGAGRVAAHGR